MCFSQQTPLHSGKGEHSFLEGKSQGYGHCVEIFWPKDHAQYII